MRKITLSFFAALVAVAMAITANGQIIVTLAGDTTAGYNGDGMPAVNARLTTPIDVATDVHGNMYISDYGNHLIRKVNAAGIISTIAGTGAAGLSGDGGPATDAQIDQPIGIAADGAGNIYFADGRNNCVRKISNTGIISAFAGVGGVTEGFAGDGGPATAALFKGTNFLAIDGAGNVLVTDAGNGRIRKINAAGIITTIAGGDTSNLGDGIPATNALLYNPSGIALDATGNIFVTTNNIIRKINSAGIISTIAGTTMVVIGIGDGGPATAANFNSPSGLAVDAQGNIYVSDTYHGRVRKISAAGIITTVTGTGACCYGGDGGPAAYAVVGDPEGLAFDKSGNLLIADAGSNSIRAIRYAVEVPEVQQMQLTLFPNPCRNQLTVMVPSGTAQRAEVSVMNITGQRVATYTLATNQQQSIATGKLAAGSYYVIVTAGNERWSQLLVVE